LRIGKLRPPRLCRAGRLAEPFGNPGTDRERHENQACRGRGSHYQESALREERARLDQPKNPWSGICGRLRMAHRSETLQRQIPLGAYDAVLGNKLSISPPYEARTCETRKRPFSIPYYMRMQWKSRSCIRYGVLGRIRAKEKRHIGHIQAIVCCATGVVDLMRFLRLAKIEPMKTARLSGRKSKPSRIMSLGPMGAPPCPKQPQLMVRPRRHAENIA